MKPITINFLNGLVLILAGLYGYFLLPLAPGEKSSITALIPTFTGIIFVILGLVWYKNPKIIAHIVAVLTFIICAMCLWRFNKIEIWDAKKYIFLVCIVSSLVALIVYIKSFIDTRIIKNQ